MAKKECFRKHDRKKIKERRCSECTDVVDCMVYSVSTSVGATEAKAVKAVKLDQGKRQYSLIIPQMMELMLPKLDDSDDNYWIRLAIMELSTAAHKDSLGDIFMHCHGAVEGLRLHLGSEQLLDELTKAMEYGAAKPEYGRNNWKKGMEWSRLLDAGMRHGIAILRGEDIDPDSGNTHLAHMLGSIHMLMGNIELGVGTDDITIK